jgi:hypothetical protein
MSSKARFLLKVTTSFYSFYLQTPACAAMKQIDLPKATAEVVFFQNPPPVQPIKSGRQTKPPGQASVKEPFSNVPKLDQS